jgi:hypothetical protein
LDLSLSARELKLLFSKDTVSLQDFLELINPGTNRKPRLQNIQWQSLLKDIFILTVKMQMDLEMLRFEVASDLQNAYQAWQEVIPDAEYE